MPTHVHMTRVLVTDLEASLPFYQRLGFTVKDDIELATMRWLTLTGPGSDHELLLAAVEAGAEVMQEPPDQPNSMRDCAVRDPSGNQVRLSRPHQ